MTDKLETASADRQKRAWQRASLAVWILGYGPYAVWQGLTPNPNDAVWVADVANNPIATGIGAFMPVLLFAPGIWWIGGKLADQQSRRQAARSKSKEDDAT